VGQPALSYFIARSTVIRGLRPSGITRSTTGAFGSFGDLGRKRENGPPCIGRIDAVLVRAQGAVLPSHGRVDCAAARRGAGPQALRSKVGPRLRPKSACPSDRYRLEGAARGEA